MFLYPTTCSVSFMVICCLKNCILIWKHVGGVIELSRIIDCDLRPQVLVWGWCLCLAWPRRGEAWAWERRGPRANHKQRARVVSAGQPRPRVPDPWLAPHRARYNNDVMDSEWRRGFSPESLVRGADVLTCGQLEETERKKTVLGPCLAVPVTASSSTTPMATCAHYYDRC